MGSLKEWLLTVFVVAVQDSLAQFLDGGKLCAATYEVSQDICGDAAGPGE
jgi:hypothetical protein